MGIYAFDGTGQQDITPQSRDADDTNISRFLQVAGVDDVEEAYKAGVGTRHGFIGKAIGGVFGAGARSRLADMFALLEAEFKAGDEQIVIVGYSRGAAMALHFANMISEATLEDRSGRRRKAPPIAFLGLFDAVASFGLSFTIGEIIDFQGMNLGWDLTVPANIQHCRHALAAHERRETFRPTRLNPGGTNPHIEEMWFRGCHADIGGGNGNRGLNAISLCWLLEGAQRAGVAVDEAQLAGYRDERDWRAAPKPNALDPVIDPPRVTLPGDTFDPHCWKSMGVGETRTIAVPAAEYYTDSEIFVRRGERFVFSFEGCWKDDDIDCGGEGWTLADVKKGPLELAIRVTQPLRRVEDAHWFELIGTLGRNRQHPFRIGNGQFASAASPYEAQRDDVLFLFANDLQWMYRNNSGAIDVTVKRVA